jgi:hypothetical protein
MNPDIVQRKSPMQTKILYIHGQNKISGAEKSLLLLLKNLDHSKYQVFMACPEGGTFGQELKSIGVKTLPLEFARLRDSIAVVRTIAWLCGIVRRVQPDFLHSNTTQTNII